MRLVPPVLVRQSIAIATRRCGSASAALPRCRPARDLELASFLQDKTRPLECSPKGGGGSRMTEPTRPVGPTLVLVAGEREGTARWLEEVFAPHGFAVFQAVNGRDALARAHATQPDAIFIDAVLPDMSGLELCRLLREDPRITPATPMLITTPHSPTREQRLAALRAGAWDCIGRARDPDELVLKLEAAMGAKRDADRARAEGLVDPSSGLYNRQGVARRAVELGSQAFRQRSALACVVFAVDL